MSAIIVQIFLNSIIAGSIYALLAVGFTFIFGAARFFDLSYGSFAIVGGYAAFLFFSVLGWPFLVAIPLAILVTALMGLGVEQLVYRPLKSRKSSNTVMLVASLGVLTVTQALIAIFFTSQFHSLTAQSAGQGVFHIFGGAITETQVAILAVMILITCALMLVLRYTTFGKAVRAVGDDEEVATIVGIDSRKIVAAVFAIGYAIAAVGGIGTVFDTGIQPTLSLALLLKAVIAMIIGGIGSIPGAVLGAFLLGFAENLGAWQFSGEWKDAIAFVVLILFLLFRPQGILGKK
ncbi:MAG: branched-chain amino acid ABC transporter permease [Patescibacteria group bacterium]|nr:branched-chain amino acid ABC transporter permease [Patescibacteria group bacterium]